MFVFLNQSLSLSLFLSGSSHFSLNSHSAYWISAFLWAFALHIVTCSLHQLSECRMYDGRSARFHSMVWAQSLCSWSIWSVGRDNKLIHLMNVKLQLWTLYQRGSCSSHLPCTFFRNGTNVWFISTLYVEVLNTGPCKAPCRVQVSCSSLAEQLAFLRFPPPPLCSSEFFGLNKN